jgi:predicted ArsR family transcriptional regulator
MRRAPRERPDAADAAITLDERQVACLATPLRHEIFMTLVSIGPASAGDVARALGRAPDGLYYHLHELVRVGLVLDLGKRPAATRPETIYDAVGHLIRTELAPRSPGYLNALKRLFASTLRSLSRRLDHALDDPSLRRSGPTRQLTLRTQLVRLDDVALAELNRRFDTLTEFVGNRSLDEGGELYQVLVAATTVERDGGA